MKPENECLTVLEEITGSATLSEAGQRHLAGCPTCAGIKRLADSMRVHESAFPLEAPISVKSRILSGFQEPQPSFWEGWFRTFALAAAFGVLTAFATFQQFQSPGLENTSAQSMYSLSKGGGAHLVPLEEAVRLDANESAQIGLPEGSLLSFSGPGTLHPQTRGFIANGGTVTSRVTKSVAPFTAATPHCTVEVLGTVFTCEISPDSTRVKVTSGKVRVISAQGDQTILEAGGEADFAIKAASPTVQIAPPLASPASITGEIHTIKPPDSD